jgi:hypothetical protein
VSSSQVLGRNYVYVEIKKGASLSNGLLLFPKPYPLLVNKKRSKPLSFSFWIILFDMLQGLLFVLCVARCKLFDVCVFFSYVFFLHSFNVFVLFSFPFNFFHFLFHSPSIFFIFNFPSFPSLFLSLLLFLSSFMIAIALHLLFAPSSLTLSCYFTICFVVLPFYLTTPWCFASRLATSPRFVVSFHDLLFCHALVLCLAPRPVVPFHNLLQKYWAFFIEYVWKVKRFKCVDLVECVWKVKR